jgi:O-acetyl-ADP-ribose deacetylase (regulator of RNase III)
MRKIKGDLLELAKQGEFNLIAHGCNCQKNFGAGLAKQIANEFPIAYEVDREEYKPELGNISIAYDMKYDLNIVNCYTQIWYGKPYGINDRNHVKEDTIKARYEAIRACLRKINEEFAGDSIGLPLIGAGLAGLEWKTIERYIEEELVDMNVTIVKLPKNSNKKSNKNTKKWK